MLTGSVLLPFKIAYDNAASIRNNIWDYPHTSFLEVLERHIVDWPVCEFQYDWRRYNLLIFSMDHFAKRRKYEYIGLNTQDILAYANTSLYVR